MNSIGFSPVFIYGLNQLRVLDYDHTSVDGIQGFRPRSSTGIM